MYWYNVISLYFVYIMLFIFKLLIREVGIYQKKIYLKYLYFFVKEINLMIVYIVYYEIFEVVLQVISKNVFFCKSDCEKYFIVRIVGNMVIYKIIIL